MQINRRLFNKLLAAITLAQAVRPNVSFSQPCCYSDEDVNTITELLAGFSLKWGGEQIRKSMAEMFLEAKLSADPSTYTTYRSVIRLYDCAIQEGLSAIECVDKVIAFANIGPSDVGFSKGVRALLSLYMTQTGFRSYGFKNIDGYIASGYLDTPTPYHVV